MKLFARLFPVAVLLATLALTPAAHAQLVLDLTPPGQAGPVSSVFNFSGTLINPTSDEVFLNGDSLTFNGPASGLSLDDSPFFNNAPLSLTGTGSGGDVYSGGFFSVSIASNAAAGTYFGTFSILGGADANAQDTVATQDFSVTVTGRADPAPVPEASSVVSLGLLLLLGAGGVFAARRRPATA